MLGYRRIHALPSGRGELLHSAWSRVGLRVYVVRSRNLVFDTQVIAPALPKLDRASLSQVAIPLGGHYRVRRDREYDLGTREFFGESSFPWNERWSGGDFAVLVVEWNESYGDCVDGFRTSRLDVRDHARVATIAEALEHGNAHDLAAVHATIALCDLLRAIGVPLAQQSVASLCDGVPRDARAFVDTLGQIESRLDAQPMWCDLERMLGQSARNLRRRRAQVLEALGRNDSASFRSWMRGLRVRTAACLATAPDTTVEEVARAVGYGSARALILAMHQAGLPSPGALRWLARDE